MGKGLGPFLSSTIIVIWYIPIWLFKYYLSSCGITNIYFHPYEYFLLHRIENIILKAQGKMKMQDPLLKIIMKNFKIEEH